MPVTKTAKRAQRSSKRKAANNKELIKKLEKALRLAKTSKTAKAISSAFSLTDRAAKKNVIHKNKAARIKSTLSKLAKPTTKKKASTGKGRTSKKK